MSAALPTAAELADYLTDHYGECALGSPRCYHGPGPQCLKVEWRGRGCQHWRPTGARDWAELLRPLRGGE